MISTKSELISQGMYELALKPHLHDSTSCNNAIDLLLNPHESLHRRGLSIWVIGRIFHIDSSTFSDKVHLQKEILSRSSEIMSGIMEVIGITKAHLRGKTQNGPYSFNDDISTKDCKSICENGSLLILMFTELLSNGKTGTSYFSPFSITFSRMSLGSLTDKKTRKEHLLKKPMHKVVKQKRFEDMDEHNKDSEYNKKEKDLNGIPMKTTKLIPITHQSQLKHGSLPWEFVRNENHESQAKGIYSRIKTSIALDKIFNHRKQHIALNKHIPYLQDIDESKLNYSPHYALHDSSTRKDIENTQKYNTNTNLIESSIPDKCNYTRSDSYQLKGYKAMRGQKLGEKLHATIISNFPLLPTHFLATVEKAHEYYKHQLQKILTKVFIAIEKANLYAAMMRWKRIIAKIIHEDEERRFRREAGARSLKAFIVEIYLDIYRNNFDKWQKKVMEIANRERQLAATIIQSLFLRYQSECRFVSMHKNFMVNGPLSDILLSPQRLNIKYFIHPVVRKERRHRWFSAIHIQSFYRMIFCKVKFLQLKKYIILIQSYCRKMIKRRSFCILRAMEIRIQSYCRTKLIRSWLHKQNINATIMQTAYRCFLHKKSFEKLKSSTFTIQMAFRMFRAKSIVEAIKRQIQKEFDAALLIQRAWYTKNGEFSTFVLLGCLREIDQAEVRLKEQVNASFREAKAKLIQRTFREHLMEKHEKSSLIIQTRYRYFRARSHYQRLKLEEKSCCLLQRTYKKRWKSKNRAATRILFAWILAKEGRLSNHIKLVKKREKKIAEELLQLKRINSSIRLQSVFRRHLSQQKYRYVRATHKMRRLVCTYILHNSKLKRNALYRTRLSTSFTEQIFNVGKSNLYANQVQDRNFKLALINEFLKSILAQCLESIQKQNDYKRDVSARKIQLYYHLFSARRKATLRALISRRKQMNQFAHEKKIGNVLNDCLELSRFLWHPSEERCGMYLPDFMRRIGMQQDVYPLLLKKGIVSTEQLYQLSENNLCEIGITDRCDSDGKQIFHNASKIRSTLLELSTFFQFSIPEDYGTRIYFYQLCDSENKLAKEFRIIPRDNRQSTLKRIFLEYFGTKNMAKAENFACRNELLEYPFSILQLRRYFEMSPNPRKVKENIFDLIIPTEVNLNPYENRDKKLKEASRISNNTTKILTIETNTSQQINDDTSPPFFDPKLWELYRIEKSFDILLFAAEHISELTSYTRLKDLVLHCQKTLIRKKLEMVGVADIKELTNQLYIILFDTYNINSAALTIQQAYRLFLSRRLLSIKRHNRTIIKAKQDYIEYRTTNHVHLTWKAIRELEEEENKKKYLELLENERRSRIEEVLKRVLRFGWEVCDNILETNQAEDVSRNKIYVFLNGSSHIQEQTEDFPAYSFSEYIAADTIIKKVRMFLAKNVLKRMMKDKIKEERIGKERQIWEKVHHEHIQFIQLHKIDTNNTFEHYESSMKYEPESNTVTEKDKYLRNPTILPLRFGWKEISDHLLIGFVNITSKELSIDPTIILFSFEEEFSAKLIQATWRGALGRKKYNAILNLEDIFDLTKRTIHRGKEIAWIGFELEGMSLEMWLARLGMSHHYDRIHEGLLYREYGKKHMASGNIIARTGENRHTKTTPSKHNNSSKINLSIRHSQNEKTKEKYHFTSQNNIRIQLFLQKFIDDEWLTNIGISNKNDKDIFKNAASSSCNNNKFKFLNYFIDGSDTRSIQQCIEDSHDLLYSIIIKMFKNNPNRVKQMVDDMTKSRFPVTMYQLERFLTLHEGKPALAQANIHDLIDIPTTSIAIREREIYNIYVESIKRIIILLKNRGVRMLADILEKKSKEAELLLCDSDNDLVGSEKNLSASRQQSGHEAKAALILRNDALQYILQIWKSSIIIQKYTRRSNQFKKYQHFILTRYRNAKTLQAFIRMHLAKIYSAILRKQQTSCWEQLWSDTDQVFYWYNKETEFASWDEPEEPYRPMVKDRFTQKLIQAWPFFEMTNTKKQQLLSEKCQFCHKNIATRECIGCAEEKEYPSHYPQFCFGCFISYHSKSATLSAHQHRLIEEVKPTGLVCCMCNGPSTRRCLGMKINSNTHKRLSRIIQREEKNKRKFIDFESFQNILLQELKLPMSKERILAIFEDSCRKTSQKPSALDTLMMVRLLIQNIGSECDDNFCVSCWELTHSKGSRSMHEWVGYRQNAMLCVECGISPAYSRCLSCIDVYCISCSKMLHSSGNRRNHKFEKIFESLGSAEDFHCSTCTNRVATEQCELCEAKVCDSCNLFSHKKHCKIWKKLKRLGCEQIKCSVCGKFPDTKCKDCGDVYCSIVWTGHPGCFAQMHQKGNRIHHTKTPYTEFKAYQDESQQRKQEAEYRLQRKQHKKIKAEAQQAARLALYQEEKLNKEKRLKNEAFREFQENLSTKSSSKNKSTFRKSILSTIYGSIGQMKKFAHIESSKVFMK